MTKQRVLLTGSTGGMGLFVLKALLKDPMDQDIILLVRDGTTNREKMKEYINNSKVTVVWGDLGSYDDIYYSLEGVDIVLHVGALVSPLADSEPELAMKINYGSMVNFIRAIHERNVSETIKFVSIGTIAQTGDRMPPIHWGRVGDPIKPSVFDYYAVSKVAAERVLIESDLKYWVSLRQTGIMGKKMAEIQDSIMFHNCLDNVLEYVSDRDSGLMLANLCRKNYEKTLDNSFWNCIYNVGGGASCRTSTTGMYEKIYGKLGIKDLSYVINPKHYATQNFHGTYYLDSDILNDYLEFRSDDMNYFYQFNIDQFGALLPISKIICKFPFGQRVIGNIIKLATKDLPWKDRGTMQFIDKNMTQEINAYWGSKENWEAIPRTMKEFNHFTDWDRVVHIDHGYDELKDKDLLNLDDMKKAAEFRGGSCTSSTMITGDWKTILSYTCAFGHQFTGSPKLILEGGHWCSACESKSWNYHQRARKDKFFAQVWNPIRKGHEVDQEVYKKVNEDIISN